MAQIGLHGFNLELTKIYGKDIFGIRTNMEIQIPSTPITRLQLAELLSISPRTLQRRLVHENMEIPPYRMLSTKEVGDLARQLGYC